MAHNPYEEAVKRRADISERLEEARLLTKSYERELAQLDAFIEMYKRLSGEVETPGDESSENIVSATPRPKNPAREHVGKFVRQILLEKGHPMPRSELFREVTRRGLNIFGKDPEMVFSTMLWRMRDQFPRLPRYGYWLADQPWSGATEAQPAYIDPFDE